MKNKVKKETKKSMILPEKNDELYYLISSLEYELKVLESIREKEDTKRKQTIPPISVK
jgi:hypothetical protein